MYKSTISMAIFNSKLLVYRVANNMAIPGNSPMGHFQWLGQIT